MTEMTEVEARTVLAELVDSVQWAVRQIDEAMADSRVASGDPAFAAWLRTIKATLTDSSERLAAELDDTERALEQVNKASVRLEGRLKEQIRDLGDLVTQLTAESDEFEGQVDAALALHQRRYWKWKSWRGFLQVLANNPEAYYKDGFCRECRKAWPCPTVQRLTGAEF